MLVCIANTGNISEDRWHTVVKKAERQLSSLQILVDLVSRKGKLSASLSSQIWKLPDSLIDKDRRSYQLHWLNQIFPIWSNNLHYMQRQSSYPSPVITLKMQDHHHLSTSPPLLIDWRKPPFSLLPSAPMYPGDTVSPGGPDVNCECLRNTVVFFQNKAKALSRK